MAKETYSLSWFKKRTAEINKLAGTKISPTQLYRTQRTSILAHELIAEQTARETAAREERTRLTAPNYAQIVRDRTVAVWSAFASSNNYAAGILQAYAEGGYFISPSGDRIYREYDGSWFAYDPATMDFKLLKGKPNAAPLTAENVNKTLAKVSKKARTQRANKPTENYRNARP